MATNAAKELLELAEAWGEGVKGKSVMSQRGASGDSTRELWSNQLSAVRLLLEVEEYVDSRDARERYIWLIAELRRFVFVPNSAWSSQAPTLEEPVKLSLHQLGELMDGSAARTLHLSPPQVDALQEAIDECLKILDPLTVANDKGLEYLRELLTRLKEALERGDVELTGIRDKAYAAFGVAVLNSESLPEESRRSFFQKLSGVVFPFASGTAAGASGNVLGTVIEGVLQISS